MSEATYLPLLNSIAVNEGKAEKLLSAWAGATRDEALAAALRFVAIREGEHAWAFTKRLCELGQAVCEEKAFQVFKDFDATLAFLGSDAADCEKVARFGGKRDKDAAPRKDPFASFFNDASIDPQTGELLGRYICEERDSGRRLTAEYDRVMAAARGPADEIAELRACLVSLQDEIAKLKGLRSVA